MFPKKIRENKNIKILPTIVAKIRLSLNESINENPNEWVNEEK